MAELQLRNYHQQEGTKRGKKLSTRIDLIPMVDLRFLLMTFFILATTMREANAIGPVLPGDKDKTDFSKNTRQQNH